MAEEVLNGIRGNMDPLKAAEEVRKAQDDQGEVLNGIRGNMDPLEARDEAAEAEAKKAGKVAKAVAKEAKDEDPAEANAPQSTSEV